MAEDRWTSAYTVMIESNGHGAFRMIDSNGPSQVDFACMNDMLAFLRIHLIPPASCSTFRVPTVGEQAIGC